MLRGFFRGIGNFFRQFFPPAPPREPPRPPPEEPPRPPPEEPLTKWTIDLEGNVHPAGEFGKVEDLVRVVAPGTLWSSDQPLLEPRKTFFGPGAAKEAADWISNIERSRHVLVLVRVSDEEYEVWLDYVEEA